MIPIVFSTDHNFVMQAGVCVLSLLMNASDEYYDIYILIAKDVTEEDRQKLMQTVEPYCAKLNFICMDNTFANAYEIRNISTAAYYRLLIPWLLPQYDKVIYADVDMIFQIGLKNVFNTNIEDNYVAGVAMPGALVSSGFRKNAEKLGLNIDEYINSGFLVINCKRQREVRLKEKYLRYSKNKYFYQDQDIINIVCKKHIFLLPQNYNVGSVIFKLYLNRKKSLLDYYSQEELKIIFTKNIIHYAGINKPWNSYCFQYDIWWYYYRCSIFYNIDFYLKHSYKLLFPEYSLKNTAKIVCEFARRLLIRN